MLFEELGKVEARSHLWADLSSHLEEVDISISNSCRRHIELELEPWVNPIINNNL